MAKPHLPPELILNIAEASVEDFHDEQYHYKKRSREERAHIRNLAITNKLLCNLARSKIFNMQYLCLYPDHLRAAADILSAPHLAKYIKVLGFCHPTDEWFYPEYTLVHPSCASRHFDDFYSASEMEHAMPAGPWIARVGISLSRIFAACAPFLRGLRILSVPWFDGKYDNLLYQALTETMSSYNFEKLETLIIQSDASALNYRFWNLYSLSNPAVFYKNMARIKELEVGGEERPGPLAFCDNTDDVCDLENFISMAAESLEKLTIPGIQPDRDSWQNAFRGLHPSCIQTHASLVKLDITWSAIEGSLSALLPGLMQTLGVLRIIGVWISPDLDRWEHFLVATLSMPLQKIELGRLFYPEGDRNPQSIAGLDSPFSGDHDAMALWQETLKKRGKFNTTDTYINQWTRFQTEASP